MLAPNEGKWVIVSLTEVVKGDPIRIWSEHERDSTVLACLFKNGNVVRGDPGTCPAPEFLLVKSLAPGCVRVVQDTVAKSGLGTPWPLECKYE
jgi:hypothetical protein